MPTKSNRSTNLPSVTTRISITGGSAVQRISNVRWLHHQSNLCGHSCILRCWVRLCLTKCLSSDITFIARVKGCTYLKKFVICTSLYNITSQKWLVNALSRMDSVRHQENMTYRVYTHTADLRKCSEDLVLDTSEYYYFRLPPKPTYKNAPPHADQPF